LYTHFLTPEADVIDDTLVYRRGWNNFLVVVNASNDDKDRTWLERCAMARCASTTTDPGRGPTATTPRSATCVTRSLVLPCGWTSPCKDRRAAISCLRWAWTTKTRAASKLKRTELCDAVVGGFDLIVSRTGYTGEKMAFELFVHPERAVDFWNAVMKAGEPFGVKPIGLGARDSLSTEAGLPLYGHEMGLGSGKFGDTPATWALPKADLVRT
jgi:glycine hydroxymethyltransferase